MSESIEPLKACSSIQTFFERNRQGVVGYGITELEMMYTDIKNVSTYVDFDVTTKDFKHSPCLVTGVVRGKISFKKDKGRFFYYNSMPPHEPGAPRHNLQLLTYQIAAAWHRYAEAKTKHGDGVLPEHWQWVKDMDVHHRCNMGDRGCHSPRHFIVVDKKTNIFHRGHVQYLICRECKIKIRMCPEEDPDKCCMNNVFVLCSKCLPDDYPNATEVQNDVTVATTPHQPDVSFGSPFKRSRRFAAPSLE